MVPTKTVSVFTRPKYTSSGPKANKQNLVDAQPSSSSDRSKQLILDLALALSLPRLGRLRLCLSLGLRRLGLGLSLALAHDGALPREGVRRRGVRFVV